MSNDGLLVMDKQPGPTSFDVVREVRRLSGGVKVGHTGSLDPFASGVLILLLGRATKLSQELLESDKVYRATVQLGSATDTMDCTGKITEEQPVPALSVEHVASVLASFGGVWHQVPPSYSAKKVHGVRLYELARQDVHVRLEPIAVKLYRIQLLSFENNRVSFETCCSKGTYVRSLAHEFGKRLGTVGHLFELRRLACGSFSIDDSVTLERFSSQVQEWLKTGYGNYLRFLRSRGGLEYRH
jgi:tRNA pseudouridine55 synthase